MDYELLYNYSTPPPVHPPVSLQERLVTRRIPRTQQPFQLNFLVSDAMTTEHSRTWILRSRLPSPVSCNVIPSCVIIDYVTRSRASFIGHSLRSYSLTLRILNSEFNDTDGSLCL